MLRTQNLRWRYLWLLALFIATFFCSLGPLSEQVSADCTKELGAVFRVKVIVQYPNSQAPAASDTLTGSQQITADKVSSTTSGNTTTVTYETGVESLSWNCTVPEPQVTETSALLNKSVTFTPALADNDANPTIVTLGPAAPISTNDSNGETTADASSPELVCTVSILNPLTWFVCPLVSAAQGAIEELTNGIDSLLTVSTSTIFSNTTTPGTTGAGFYQAWNTFRLFAVGLIIIAGLVMLSAQAIGSDLISPYTVRRVLPRLLAAIIFISLSWFILEFLVGLTNDVGNGVRAIIYTPFNTIGNTVRIGGGASTVGALVGGAGLLALGLVGLGTFILTAFLAVFVGFIILLLRQVIIMMLIIFAPLAIACYILPGTEKAWKFWRDTLISMLVAFPIISAFIAMGRVFAVVMYNAPIAGVPSVINEIGAFIMYFLPYFMLPLAFRMAGGAIANIAGFVNDKHRGLFDRLKQKRSDIASDRISRARSESLYSPDSFMGKFRNKAASWATAPYSNLAYEVANRSNRSIPFLSRTGTKVAAGIHAKKMAQTGDLLKTLNDQFAYNDKAYRALSGTYAGFGEETRARLVGAGFMDASGRTLKRLDSMKNINEMADILGQSSSSTDRLAAGALRGSAGHLASLYASTDTNKADAQAAALMGLASHGFATGDDLANYANQVDSGDRNSHSWAESVGVQAQVMGQRSRPDIKAGYGLVYRTHDSAGRAVTPGWVSGISAEGGRADNLLETLNSHDLASAKGGAFDALAPAITTALDAGGNKGRAVQDQLFSWAGPYSQASQDIKIKALEMIDRRGLRDDFERYARR